MIYPGQLDLEILQGATFYKRIVWKKGDGLPFNLEHCTIRMQVRYAHQAPDILLEASTDNGRILLEEPEQGTFAITLTPAETDELNFPSALYDLEVEMENGTVYRPIEGKVKVLLQVTR